MLTNILTEALGWTLLHSLWQGLVVMTALGILLTLMKGRSPESRYYVSLLALGAMFAWIVATFFAQYNTISDQYFLAGYAAEWSGDFSEDFYAADGVSPEISFSLWSFSEKIRPFMPWISVIWAAGFMFFTVRWAGGLYHIHQLRSNGIRPVAYDWQLKVNKLSERLGLTRTITLYESFRVSVPIVIGHLKPVILLPVGMLNGISPAQLEAVIVHELAHVRRNDFAVNLLISLVESMLFYHPAYWWISSHIQAEREHCCDDLAVKYCGDPLSYAKVLADLEENRLENMRLAMQLVGRKKYLLRRIRRIVVPEASEPQIQGKSVFGLVLVITMTAIAWLSPQTGRTFGTNYAEEMDYDFPILASIPSVPGMIGYPEFYAAIDTPPPGTEPLDEPVGGWGEMPEMPEMPEFPEFPDNFYSSALPDSAAMAEFKMSMQQFQEEQKEWGRQVGEYWREYAQQLSAQSNVYAHAESSRRLEHALEKLAQAEIYANEDQIRELAEAQERLAEVRERLAEDREGRSEMQIERDLQRREEDIIRRHEEAKERELAALERAREMQERQREIQLRQQEIMEQNRERMREVEEKVRRDQEARMHEMEVKMKAMHERHDSMKKELQSELRRDGLVSSDNGKVKIKISEDSFKINGQKLTEDQERKYRRILKKYGFNAGDEGTLQFDF
ncbi:MAG: M56 family metallopeptidase [Bacteroidia bacterium]